MTEEKEMLLYYKEKCSEAYGKYLAIKDLYVAHRNEWIYWRDRFEKLDRKLAETDGRLHICSPGKSGKQPMKAPELTKDQLLAIAEKLGIEIREPDKEVSDEEE
jgi:hypothetical protein